MVGSQNREMVPCETCSELTPVDEMCSHGALDVCQSCHDRFYDQWSTSSGAEAYIEAAQPVFPYKRK